MSYQFESVDLDACEYKIIMVSGYHSDHDLPLVLIKGILHDTGIKVGDAITDPARPNMFTWEIPDDFTPLYLKHREIIAQRIALFQISGVISYGSW